MPAIKGSLVGHEPPRNPGVRSPAVTVSERGIVMSTGRLETLKAQQAQALQKAKMILDHAEREQRALTADEEKAHAQLLASVEDLGKRIDQLTSDAELIAKV